jgi:hypothetical protein
MVGAVSLKMFVANYGSNEVAKRSGGASLVASVYVSFPAFLLPLSSSSCFLSFLWV